MYAGIGFPVPGRTDSKTENPDPIPNNISNHNSKINTERKIETIQSKKLGHVPGYVSRERGAIVLLSIRDTSLFRRVLCIGFRRQGEDVI